MTYDCKFKIHQPVWKATGDYQLPGKVISSGSTGNGKTMYCVEHPFGFTHNYREPNLVALTPEHTENFRDQLCRMFNLVKAEDV